MHAPRRATHILAVGLSLLAALLAVMPALAAASAAAPAGLVNYWPADGNAVDVVGGQNGTTVGGVTYAPGVSGQAWSLNGTSAYIDFGSAAGNFGTGDFTLTWLMSTTSTRHEDILSKRSYCDATGSWDIHMDAGHIVVEMWPVSVIWGAQAVNDGQFHQIALERQGATLALYVDGQLDGMAPIAADVQGSSPMQVAGGGCFAIGQDSRYTGLLDELQIYNRALSTTELQGLRSKPVPTSAEQCKDDGWKAFGVFKNQGDCVSFVATAGKNAPAK